MPLLNKKPFKKLPPPNDVSPDTKVFFLEATQEIFTNHDDYYKRMVLLNSTCWSCALTRKTNLTYFEAVESEQEAANDLSIFPDYLVKPILFIVSNYTKRGRFEDLVNDIFWIMKDRFFISEEVIYSERNRRMPAKIVGSFVIPEESGPLCEPLAVQEAKEPKLPPSENYRYTIQILDGLHVSDDGLREGVPPEKIFRSKNVGSRQKIKLFLKNSTEIPYSGDHYVVRDEYLADGIVRNLRWNLIMSGSEPTCPSTPVTQRGRIPNVLKPGYVEPFKKIKKIKTADESGPKPRGRPKKNPDATPTKSVKKRKNKDIQDSESTPKKRKSLSAPKMSEKKRQKIIEQQAELEFLFSEAKRLGIDVGELQQSEKVLSSKVISEFKLVVKEAKDKEREQLKEEKRRKNKEKINYNKKRDDLMCDDLKPMPKLPKLQLPPWLSDEEFSELLFIMQFFCSFKELLPLKEIRGHTEILFSDVVIAVKCNDPQNSPYADLMRVLLSARTDIADEEDGDEADFSNREEVYLLNSQSCDPGNPIHGDVIREITVAHEMVRKIHGKSVRHLPVDWMTLSEVIRLIFITSGYYSGHSTHRHRLFSRGNFKGFEDPCYELREQNPELIEKLKTQTVFDMEPHERLIIMKTIILQLLTYAKFRNFIEQKQNQMFEKRKDIKKLKLWDAAQEQEANSARVALEHEIDEASKSGAAMKPIQQGAVAKRLRAHLKAINENRRDDKNDLESILLVGVPYNELELDEIVKARELQKLECAALQKKMIQSVYDIQVSTGDIFLGNDRAFRRYFVIDNLPALIVENCTEADRIGECEEPTMIACLVESEDRRVYVCSGEMATCNVHGRRRLERPRWCYIPDVDTLEKLIGVLNPRGFRECELNEQLAFYKPSLEELLESTSEIVENGEWLEALMTHDTDPGDTYNIDWEAELRDLLLDFEEKVDQGQMGSLNATFGVDRATWRQHLRESGDVSDLLNVEIKIGNEVVVTPDDAKQFNEVKQLALAFLQIVQCIGIKFIRMPFAVRKEEVLRATETFRRWQRALLECGSLSALTLFLSTLESAIQWDKSRLQGKCRQCRRKGATSELVLCHECDNCYHLACVKLARDAPTPIEWYCSACRAQSRKLANEAKRKARDVIEPLEADVGSEEHTIEMDDGGVGSGRPQRSSDTENQNVTRTQSGRAVRKVHYTELAVATPPLKPRQRKSNVASSERPARAKHVRTFDDFSNIESSEDEEFSDRRQRRSMKRKQSSPPEIVNPSRNSATSIKEKMAALEQLLKESMRQECSWPFLEPVDPKEVPDYYDVIKRPMDLRSMMNKLKQRVYNHPEEVRNDFDLIITNCETYNETESEIFQLSRELEAFVVGRMDAIVKGM
ncbi:unnamed protein product [Caenorhabditis bovis]|uniref:Bromodomain adjacent to zinc finger domain protein 1A n=1 Tax=Caenorhabditis bovis TaxID=2654633 RepID=A0A8S1F414_9PELO|nr:unnamed protein product [Caenorhabditis bovis]